MIIISQSMARQMFPGQNPLGRRIRSWRDENVYRKIVGVADDVRYNGLTEDLGNNVSVPHRQDSWGMLVVVLRLFDNGQVGRIAVHIDHPRARMPWSGKCLLEEVSSGSYVKKSIVAPVESTALYK